MNKRVAIVNQRYGIEVNGGSEFYTKKLAEYLNGIYNIEVLTTTAKDYDTWKPYYNNGIEVVDGVKVRRFPVRKNRNILFFKLINKLVISFPFLWRVLEPLWIFLQGPYCPDLIKYIKTANNDYDIFIFVTYLYYTTVKGLPLVREKSVLVPTAHDEYCIYFREYSKLFAAARKIIYLTVEEKDFVESVFHNENMINAVAGTGVDLTITSDSEEFINQYNLDDDYFIYIGRVDTSKACDKLFDAFIEFKKKYPSRLKLVVIGKLMMELPIDDEIICVGFVSEEEKYGLLSKARALIMPSEFESLSLVVLEAMAMGVPVIVNGNCKVLKAHCTKSKAGVWYLNQKEFGKCLFEMMQTNDNYKNMQANGKIYIEENYNWEKTIKIYRDVIERRNYENN